jgi:endonuclease G
MNSHSRRLQNYHSWYFRFAAVFALAAMMFVTLSSTRVVRPVQALSSGVVISQVYGGGGNSGATFTNDFIELFNRGTSPISLNGWAVQYGSATGTTWQVTPLTNVTLQPGQYYLIQEAAGTGGTTPLPAPDATGAIAMALGAGKIALTNSTTGLTGACPTGGSIVDFVGYGSTANCSETAPTGTTANPTAAVRNNGGCAETDNNSADFTVTTPNPRNTNDDLFSCSGTTNPSGIGAANPNALPPGSSSLLTVTVTPGTNPASTGITVMGDLSAIGGSATQQFFDNATNGDVTAGDNIFSYQATVAGGTSGGPKSLPISIADAQARSGSTGISLTVQANSNPSVAGAANPSSVAQGASVVLTGTVTPGLVPNSTGITVTGDLSAIGGSATQPFFDDGATGGDTVANNNVFTFTMIVPGATTTGAKNLPLTVTDAQARSGSGNISLTVTTPPAAHDPSEHMVMGNPNGATADTAFPDNYLMMKLQYALSYNNTREIPNWTSWHLDSTWRGSAARQDDFRNDTTLPAGFHQVQGTDYSGSGFDRGHMCPSADRTSSIPDNSATFLMTNMVPQAPGNNQGPWAAMENYIRTFLPGSELYIISGGFGVGGTGSGGGTTNVLASGVTVPNKTWKVVMVLPVGDNDLSRVDSNTRTFAVIMPNIDSIRPDQWQKYLATVDQVETLTGYDFFSNVLVATQDAIEPKLDAANDTAPVTTNMTRGVGNNHSVPVTLTATDFNVNNTVFTFTVVAPPQHGTLSGSGANLIYTPDSTYTGPDTFTYKANDGALDSNTSTVSITVTGPTAAPATISGRITTADGAPLGGVTMNLGGARSARAITDSQGNYSFRNIDTDNFYTVTPSLMNYHFGPESQSFSLLANKTDAMFTASRDAVFSGNAIDTADYFVRQHYLDFLGREPDESGFNFWSDQITSCAGDAGCIERRTISVSAAYFLSIEFQQTGGLVDGLYRASYARAPRYAEFMPDTAVVAQGVVVGPTDWAERLAANKQAFVDAWVQRAEFRAAYEGLSNSAFVDQLIANAGGGFNGDRAALVSGLNHNTMTRAAVLSQVVENEGFVRSKSNQMFVMMEYFGYLRRDPDESGYAFWLKKLNQFDGNFEQAEMVKAFIRSGEYRDRFRQ